MVQGTPTEIAEMAATGNVDTAIATEGLAQFDADVIKTYVELGLGIGIIANMAFDPIKDSPLQSLDISHLFAPSTTHLGIKRGSYLRGFGYDFIEYLAPHLTRKVVDKATQT